MRPLVTRIVRNLSCPDEPLLVEARDAPADAAAHARFLESIEAFQTIEYRSSRQTTQRSGRLRVAALNAERLADPGSVRRLVDSVGADVMLLSEVDVGMARSGNVHTVRELTGLSDLSYVYGVEFVELDLGDKEEMRCHAGERNACSLHGNAIVSSLAIEQPILIPLEEKGLWFKGFDGAQRRIGGRIALAVRIMRETQPLWFVSLHLESKTDPGDRQSQIRCLLRALDDIAPNEACIIGGDCNTKALPRGDGARDRLLKEPERYEPLFADMRDAGFGWVDANLPRPTQRDGPSKTHPQPFGKLDWFFVRGATAENPQVVPSLDPQGRPISDHELIAVDLIV